MVDLEWSTNTDWTNAQSTTNIDINSGTFELADAIPDSGVSRWEFEDASDPTTAIDSWGDNDGAVNGATYTTTSTVGSRALSFDGTDDRVDVSDDASFSGLAELSISFWGRLRSTGDRKKFLAKGVDVGGDRSYEWEFTKDADETIRFDVADGFGHSFVQPTDTVLTNTWYHIVGVYSNSGDYIELYLDGSRIGRTDGVVTMQDDTGPLVFGAENGAGSGDDWLDGYLDDLRIYSKALSSTEVSNLYNTGRI